MDVARTDAGDLEAAEGVAAEIEAVGDADRVAVPAVDIADVAQEAEDEVLGETVEPAAANSLLR